jgi:hypothetical protein
MALESSIISTVDGMHELSLQGRIHRPHWIIQLFGSLSALQVSIISGQATQEKRGEWKSRFILDFSNSSADPKHLDYAAFSEKTPSGDRSAMAPKLTRFELSRRPDQQLELKLEGPDQIGFLASILGRVSVFALFPSSLEIDTLRGQIRDVIVLRGIGDRGPGDAAYQSLERMLRGFVIT